MTTAVLPMKQGDQLTRSEFERRYAAMPDHVRAELVEGKVHMPAAIRAREHGGPHGLLMGWLSHYFMNTPVVDVYPPTSLRLDDENMPEPDAVLCLKPEFGGASRVDDDGYLSGCPELVAEIAASTTSHDLHEKFEAYRRNGVREYVVWLTRQGEVRRHVLNGNEYKLSSAGDDQVFKSGTFPGLWLDVPALLAGDRGQVVATLDAGMTTPEHRDFSSQSARPAR